MNRLKKFREKLAEKAGFTLVELIVVIAILAILAAVAVPTYTGYISRAREAGDLQLLSSVATAVVGSEAGEGNEVTKITVTRKASGAATIGVTGTTDEGGTLSALTNADEVQKLLGMDLTELNSAFEADWATATMENGEWNLTGTTPTT